MPNESSCQACGGSDNRRMVACDKCGTWWHFDCVGVGESISEKDFLCRKCIFVGKEDHPATKNSQKAPSVAGSDAGASASSTRAKTKLRLLKLQEEKELMQRQLELERAEQRRRHEAERLLMDNEVEKKQLEIDSLFLQEKFRALEEECEDECDDQRSRKSVQSSISKVKQWREQHLGGLANSTVVTPETVPVPITTSTAAVQDPTQAKPIQSVANSASVASVFSSTVYGTGPTTTISASNNTSAGVVAVQTSQMIVPAPTTSSTLPVYPKYPMTQPSPRAAMGGPLNQPSIPSNRTSNHLGGLLNLTSQQYPFGDSAGKRHRNQ